MLVHPVTLVAPPVCRRLLSMSAKSQTEMMVARLTKIVCYQLESLGVIGDLIVEASKIESVQNEVIVDLAKVFVAF